jgi:indole-3-glycerol phosphate synthase
MNILDEIIGYKKSEVERRQRRVSFSELEKSAGFYRPVLSLKNFLADKHRTGIIAEFKRRSPSKGILNATADVVDVTTAYAENGASGLSILTDETYFGGSNEDLRKARINQIPVLRKDFIIHEYQIAEAKSIGADVILLIASCLTPKQVKQFAVFARRLGMEVLLELHEENELDHICEETELIGINNRNLKTFEVNIEKSLRMAEQIPASKIKVAESGIHSVEIIKQFRQNGYQGFLIGENFMKAKNPGEAFKHFIEQLKNPSLLE